MRFPLFIRTLVELGELKPLVEVATEDLVDEVVGCGDYIGARQVIEDHLLLAVIESKMLDKIVPVRSQYAVVLGYCGEHVAASAELDRLAPIGRDSPPSSAPRSTIRPDWWRNYAALACATSG